MCGGVLLMFITHTSGHVQFSCSHFTFTLCQPVPLHATCCELMIISGVLCALVFVCVWRPLQARQSAQLRFTALMPCM